MDIEYTSLALAAVVKTLSRFCSSYYVFVLMIDP
jgi:hypothetical protein